MNLDSTSFVAEPELIQALKGRSRPLDCTLDRILFQQGDEAVGIYIVHMGEVEMTMCDDYGDLVMTAHALPGSLLGLPGVVGGCPYSLSAVARAGSEVSFVPREEFSQVMLGQPNLAVMILHVLAAQVRSARISACKA